jgi:nitroreductase
MITATSSNPWDITADDFPAYGTPAAKWKYLIGYAALAPSSHNSQPWLFRLGHHRLELHADRSRACPVVDPENRELVMSCGCALFHLLTAMTHFGCLGEVEILPQSTNPDLLARVSLGFQGAVTPESSLLLHAIPKRRTNRQPFRDEPIPASLLQALASAANRQSAWLRFAIDPESKQAIADLVAEGDLRQWSNPAFRIELAKWVLPNHTPRKDGIPGYAQGLDDLMSCMAPLVVRTFDMGNGQAAKNHEVATESPALAVLGTKGDTPRDWLAAGQALANVLLRARVEDVWASFLNQPIELPDLRQQLARQAGNLGFPQAILRLGFGDEVKPTPRRPVDAVLI